MDVSVIAERYERDVRPRRVAAVCRVSCGSRRMRSARLLSRAELWPTRPAPASTSGSRARSVCSR